MAGSESINRNMTPLFAVLVCWAGTACLASYLYQPPTPIAIEASEDVFSAERAFLSLEEMVGSNLPRPVGSDENARVRGFIVNAMESYGYTVESQTGTRAISRAVKNRSAKIGLIELTNVIAAKNLAKSDRKKLVVVAHYDSVPFGPGASDNGVGVAAVLEVARMLQNREMNREVVFLFTDGEELSLLGADVFMDEHPLADDVGLVVNLDARGTTGPSLMFETSQSTSELIPVFARASKTKYASSLFYEVYKRMPRDTDFSVFKRAGIEGYNFAFIGNVRNYHTPADSLQNVDRGSLQHHGEHVLGLVNEIDRSPELDHFFEKHDTADSKVGSQVVYFDLMGRSLVYWPVRTAFFAAIGMVLVVVGFATEAMISRSNASLGVSVSAIFSSTLRLVLAAVLSAAGVGLVMWLMSFDAALSNPWPESPVLISIALWMTGMALVVTVSLAFRRGDNDAPTSEGQVPQRQLGVAKSYSLAWLGVASIVSLLSTMFLPGASYLFQVPLAIGLIAFAATRFFLAKSVAADAMMGWSAFVVAVGAGLVWLPLEPLFYDAVGFKMPPATMLRVAWVTTSAMPLVCILSSRNRFALTIVLAVVAVAAMLIARM